MSDLKTLEHKARDGPSDPNALAMWRILNRLHDRNETMYYKVSYKLQYIFIYVAVRDQVKIGILHLLSLGDSLIHVLPMGMSWCSPRTHEKISGNFTQHQIQGKILNFTKTWEDRGAFKSKYFRPS